MSVIDNRRAAAAAAGETVTREAVIRSAVPKRHYWKVVRLIVLSDIATVVLATVVASVAADPSKPLPPLGWVLVTVPLTVALFSVQRLYERDRSQISISTLDEVRDILTSLGLVGFAVFSLALGFHAPWVLPPHSLSVVFFWIAGHRADPGGARRPPATGDPLATDPQRTLVIGAGRVGQAIVRKIRKNPQYNVEVIGFLDDDPAALDPDVADVPVIGAESELVETILKNGVTRIVLAFSRSTHEDVLQVVRNAGLRDVHISIVPRYFEIIAANVGIVDVEGIPVLELPVAGPVAACTHDEEGVRPRPDRAGPHPDFAATPSHRGRDQDRQSRPGAVQAGADGARGRGVRDPQIPDDGAGRRADA